MLLGTTYSHRHIKKLGLDHSHAFHNLLDLKFDLIRLCCYWDEIQPDRTTYNFDFFHNILEQCEKNRQKVLFAFGMKTPRWPEFYIPSWTATSEPHLCENYLIPYVEKIAATFKRYSSILAWQVENEPLDPSGPQWKTVPLDWLRKASAIVKKYDDRSVVVTAWGNELSSRKLFPKLESIGDIVGLDLYYQQPYGHILGKTMFRGPVDSNPYINTLIRQSTKPVWITELQAEPWGQTNPTSESNKKFLYYNYEKALELKVDAILFWGYEYWYKQQVEGDPIMIETIKKFIADNVLSQTNLT